MCNNIKIIEIKFRRDTKLEDYFHEGSMYYARKYAQKENASTQDELDILIIKAVQRRYIIDNIEKIDIFQLNLPQNAKEYQFGFHAATKSIKDTVVILKTSLDMRVVTNPADKEALPMGIIELGKTIDILNEYEKLLDNTFVPFSKVIELVDAIRNLTSTSVVVRDEKTEENHQKEIQELYKKLGVNQ